MKPIPFLDAFHGDSLESLMSQAAILIGLRYRLWPYAAAPARMIAASDRRVEFSEVLAPDEADALRVPEIGELKERISAARHDEVLGRFERRTGRSFGLRAFDPEDPAPKRIAVLAESAEKERDPLDAAALMVACLEHPHPLVRVAAAAAYGQLYADLDFVRPVLEDGIRVRADLVIMLDGGGQRFRDARIRENVLNLWFNHSATHEPGVWRTHRVPSMI